MTARSDDLLRASLGRLARNREDIEAWTTLYTSMWPFVYATIYRFLRGDPAQAKDLSQEVFIRLIKYAPWSKLTEPSVCKAYLTTVCKNVTRTYLRTKHPNLELELESERETRARAVSRESSPERIADFRQRLDQILGNLEGTDHLIAVMLMEGNTLSEIAEKTGLRTGAIAARIFRFRARLRNYLKG